MKTHAYDLDERDFDLKLVALQELRYLRRLNAIKELHFLSRNPLGSILHFY